MAVEEMKIMLCFFNDIEEDCGLILSLNLCSRKVKWDSMR